MAFHTHDYDVYIYLGDPSTLPLWSWPVWRQLLPALDPLMNIARGKPAVRSSQYLPNEAGTVKFGRLGWTEAHHQKWTHASPRNANESKHWKFVNVQVWAPGWMQCMREDQAADVFLSVNSEAMSGGYRKTLSFEPVVVLAVALTFARQEPALLTHVRSNLFRATCPKLSGHRQRPWGISIGARGYTNSVQDLGAMGLFKGGRRYGIPVNSDLLLDNWEQVPA